MSVVVVTGSAGLIGSEASAYFAAKGMDVVGIDNDMRSYFFGAEASTQWNQTRLEQALGKRYRHVDADIRDAAAINRVFAEYGTTISLVIHSAAQPSHDWAAKEPLTDFGVNALGTLHLLDAARQHCPEAPFIFTSTNKVYGDRPNSLPLEELENRWEISAHHQFHAEGIPETMSIDESTHSIFGASKVSADIMVQEYGRYFGMKTACFRGGCLTGPNHSGAQLHGFLAYLMKCAATDRHYTVFGYKGKQVRDNIHSSDLIRAFDAFFEAPLSARVYNIGGGRFSNCSMIEAIRMCEGITGKSMRWSYSETNRTGDHIWWISDLSRFKADYPEWKLQYDVPAILREMYDLNQERWSAESKLKDNA